MARRKLLEPELLTPPASGKARVRETTERTYLADVEDEETASEPGETTAPPFSELFPQFDDLVSTDDRCTILVWHLPSYEKDGRVRPPDQAYYGSIPFTKGDESKMLDDLRERVPIEGF